MLRLAVMGDLHYPRIEQELSGMVEARDAFFDSYLDSFFRIEADLHVSIGDLTHCGYEDEFQYVYRQVRERGVNFRQVLGNHDVLALPKKEIVPIIGQPRYGAVETEEALLIFLDTTKEMELHGWGLDSEQWDWIEGQIERSPELPMLIFAHHPVPDTTADSPSGAAAFDSGQDLRSIMQRRTGGGLYFNGHTHTHSIVSKDWWHFVQTAASLCDPCFRIVEIESGEVRVKTVRFEGRTEVANSCRILYDQLTGFHRPARSVPDDADLVCTARMA